MKPPAWLQGFASLELQHTVQTSGQEGYPAQIIGAQGTIYPKLMIQGGVVVQPPRSPVRAALQASFVGARRASENNILLNGRPYTLAPYVRLEAKISTEGFQLFGHAEQKASFALSGKNLLGATGPTPGFSGVDYPLLPRAVFLEMNLTL